jgi:NAD(P)-dependent dehydrogenase (short-subunit alcohol dehydrogenase family)
MRNKVVLVMGMAHGCGRVLAESFAAEGAKVVGCDVDAVAGAAVRRRVADAGHEMAFVHADVSDEAAVRNVIERGD